MNLQHTSPAATSNAMLSIMQRCLTETSDSCVQEGTEWIQKQLDCSASVVCQIEVGEKVTLRKFVNGGYQDEWIDHYVSDGLEEIDPIVNFACSAQGLFTWNQAYDARSGRATKHFRKSASQFGLTDGYTFSYTKKINHATSRTTLCSVPTPAPDNIAQAQFIMAHLVPAFHVRLSCLPSMHSPLSTREAEILAWSRAGKTVWEQSQILNITESTVKYHLLNCYRKLDVKNRAQAVARGIELGLLSPL